MYCQSCGAEVREGLRYCNRCGTSLIPAEKAAPPKLMTMIWVLLGTIALISITGFLIVFFFAIEVLSRRDTSAEVVVLLMLFTLVVFGIVALLSRQLSRALGVYLQTGEVPQSEKSQLNASQISKQLTEPQQSPARIDTVFQTAASETRQTMRPLQTDEPMTRKLETEE